MLQGIMSFLENGLFATILPHSLALYPSADLMVSVAVKAGYGMAACGVSFSVTFLSVASGLALPCVCVLRMLYTHVRVCVYKVLLAQHSRPVRGIYSQLWPVMYVCQEADVFQLRHICPHMCRCGVLVATCVWLLVTASADIG